MSKRKASDINKSKRMKYSKDSFDRFGDDLCGLIISYFDNPTQVYCQSVSKQWLRCTFERVNKLIIGWNPNRIKGLSSKRLIKLFNNVKTLEIDYQINSSTRRMVINKLPNIVNLCFTGSSFDIYSITAKDEIPLKIKNLKFKTQVFVFDAECIDLFVKYFGRIVTYIKELYIMPSALTNTPQFVQHFLIKMAEIPNINTLGLFCYLPQVFKLTHFNQLVDNSFKLKNLKIILSCQCFLIDITEGLVNKKLKNLIITTTLVNKLNFTELHNNYTNMVKAINFVQRLNVESHYSFNSRYNFCWLYIDKANIGIKIPKETRYLIFDYFCEENYTQSEGNRCGSVQLCRYIWNTPKLQYIQTREDMISDEIIDAMLEKANQNPCIKYCLTVLEPSKTYVIKNLTLRFNVNVYNKM